MLAAIAEDVVAAHSNATDGTWQLAWTLQEIQARTTDHDLRLSSIYSQSFLLNCFFPSQEPPYRFLKRFSDDNNVIGLAFLPRDPRAELAWQVFKHNDEEQWAEYRALVNTDLYLTLLHCIPHQHGHGSVHRHTSPASVAQSTPPHSVFSAPSRWPSVTLDQMRYRVSCCQLDTSLAVTWQQRLPLLCLCLGWS